MTAPIVVGYTATPEGADAIAVGSRLAIATGAALRLVIVTPQTARNAQVPPQAGYDAMLRERSREWLRDASTLIPEGVEHSAHVRPAESFAEGLIAAAAEFGASAIVIGAANGGLRGRHRLGSVASMLLHSSEVPVVLAPASSADSTTPISRLTATVGTRTGAGAVVEEAVGLAKTAGVPLRLVSLVALDLPAGADPQTIDVTATMHADEVLQQAREQLGDSAAEAVVASGNSVEEAITGLEWQAGEFVIVGSSRLAQPRRLFLGSTAAKMLHVLPVPMIVVPRTRTEGN